MKFDAAESLCYTALLLPNGAVAQLGERYNRTVEVRGSIPLSSTNIVSVVISVLYLAACKFRWFVVSLLVKFDAITEIHTINQV